MKRYHVGMLIPPDRLDRITTVAIPARDSFPFLYELMGCQTLQPVICPPEWGENVTTYVDEEGAPEAVGAR